MGQSLVRPTPMLDEVGQPLAGRHHREHVLLLGDLEPPAQRGVLRSHPALPRVDVLKVAHHGSAHQDTALLRSTRPRLALISCGSDNPYGHPAARTVEALEATGAKVLRTDINGAIAVAGGLVGIALLGTGAVVGVLSGASPGKRAFRQLAIGFGAAIVTYALGLLFGTGSA